MWRVRIYRLLIAFAILCSTCFGVGFDPVLWNVDNIFPSPVRVDIGNDGKIYMGASERRLWDLTKAMKERGMDMLPRTRDFTHNKRAYVVEIKQRIKAECVRFVRPECFGYERIGVLSDIYYTPTSLMSDCGLPSDYLDETPYINWEVDTDYSYFGLVEVMKKLICTTSLGLSGLPFSGNFAERTVRSDIDGANFNEATYKSVNYETFQTNSGVLITNSYSTTDTESNNGNPSDLESNYNIVYTNYSSAYQNRWTASISAVYMESEDNYERSETTIYTALIGDDTATIKTFSSIDETFTTLSAPNTLGIFDLLEDGECYRGNVFPYKSSGNVKIQLYHYYTLPDGEASTNTYVIQNPDCTPVRTSTVVQTYTKTCIGSGAFLSNNVENSYTLLPGNHGLYFDEYSKVTSWYNTTVQTDGEGQHFFLNREPPYDPISLDSVVYNKILGPFGGAEQVTTSDATTMNVRQIRSLTERDVSKTGYYLPITSINLTLGNVLIMYRMDLEGGYEFY